MARRDDLDRELDHGQLDELPPNIPPGFLGEVSPNMRKPESYKPTLNAGIIQESTWETRWLVIILTYLLVLTSPVAFFLLWKPRTRSLRVKLVASAIMIAGYVALYLYVKPVG